MPSSYKGGAIVTERGDEGRLEWPLAKPKRKHVHRVLEIHQLPVLHETRRSGRPYTLVLTKTEALSSGKPPGPGSLRNE